MWFSTCKIHDVENPIRKIRSFRRVENHVSYVTYVTEPTLDSTATNSLGCRPTYRECVAFLRKTIRVRELVVLVRLSHSHGFAQKHKAFQIHGTALSLVISTVGRTKLL